MFAATRGGHAYGAATRHNSASSSLAFPEEKKKKRSRHYNRVCGPKTALESVTDILKGLAGTEREGFFWAEDLLLSKDVIVTVDEIGTLKFPLSEDDVKTLIKVSSKAKFGKGEQTILDTKVRDTQMIPANKLKVEIDDKAFNEALTRISSGLKTNKNVSLVPHLYNMLIYGPGQFFKKHKDTEKVKNMVATLVVLLPSVYKGGDLIIEHNKKQHRFFAIHNPDIVKCVAFYADCEHEIKKVTEGYRVALTFNLALDVCEEINVGEINTPLNEVVASYFSERDQRKKLVCYFNHLYSEDNLKWDLLKATDHTCALALLAIAKEQGRVPFLALTTHHTTHSVGNGDYYGFGRYHGYGRFSTAEDQDLIEEETTLDFWVDEKNNNVTEQIGTCNADNHEISCTTKKIDLFEPFNQEEKEYMGNYGGTRDKWYRRACIVLWASKWAYSKGFKESLDELHQLTTQVGNEKLILDVLNKIKMDILVEDRIDTEEDWIDTDITQKIIEIVMYINDTEKATEILSQMPDELLKFDDQMDQISKLEKQFSTSIWPKVLKSWKSGRQWSEKVDFALNFIDKYNKYIGIARKSVICKTLLNKVVKTMPQNQEIYQEIYPLGPNKQNRIQTLVKLLETCVDFKKSLGPKIINDLLSQVPVVYSIDDVSELFLRVYDTLGPVKFVYYAECQHSIMSEVDKAVQKLNDSCQDWSIEVTIPCDCEFCMPVKKCLNSKISKKVVVSTAEANRKHVIRYLKNYKEKPFKYYIDKNCGTPYKLVVEKDENMLKEHETMLNNLIRIKKQLEGIPQ